MLYPAIGDLTQKTENRYMLVILASKRAREIFKEELEHINEYVDIEKPVSEAINEIAEGKISYRTLQD